MPKKNVKSKGLVTTSSVVEGATALCRDNAKRLLRNARILFLECGSGGSEGLAYVLWSLAVEEFGKSLLLQREVANASDQGTIRIVRTPDHDAKFNAGYDDIPELRDIRLARALRVRVNTETEALPLKDPLKGGATAVVPAGKTGILPNGLDDTPAVELTVKTRMAFLYVDWSPELKRWTRPGEVVRTEGLEARWEIDRSDLSKALDALQRRLEDVTR